MNQEQKMAKMKLHFSALYPLLCDAETTAWQASDVMVTESDLQDDLTKVTIGSQLLR